jgi:hypothetical protein
MLCWKLLELDELMHNACVYTIFEALLIYKILWITDIY